MIQEAVQNGMYYCVSPTPLSAMPHVNGNLAMLVNLLQSHEELLIVPLFLLVVGTLAFTAIWRQTRATPVTPEEAERVYEVRRGEDVVFRTRAYDVELRVEAEGVRPAFNFYGPSVDDDRVTLALFPWTEGLQVTSIDATDAMDVDVDGAK